MKPMESNIRYWITVGAIVMGFFVAKL